MTVQSARRFSITMMLFMFAVLLACHWMLKSYYGVETLPSPNSGETKVDSDGFPEVDWAYWQGINSDVIGWITIPDTEINYPILQANPNDRNYYLSHNVYGDWDFMGAVHLDADCFDAGLDSKNAVILAHSLYTGSSTAMFTPLIQYDDQDFANSHSRILIQTPDSKRVVDATSVQTINGGEPAKFTQFDNDAELYEYEASCYNNSGTKIADEEPKTNQMFTLCTCSYFFNPSNERILVYGALKAKI